MKKRFSSGQSPQATEQGMNDSLTVCVIDIKPTGQRKGMSNEMVYATKQIVLL